MDFQKMFDAMSKVERMSRSNYHLTLGALIGFLSEAVPKKSVVFDVGNAPGRPHSYRGYYADLALEPSGATTAAALLKVLRASLGHEFTGYKGGEFIMDERTPLWCASHGNTGRAIVGVTSQDKGPIVLTTKDMDL